MTRDCAPPPARIGPPRAFACEQDDQTQRTSSFETYIRRVGCGVPAAYSGPARPAVPWLRAHAGSSAACQVEIGSHPIVAHHAPCLRACPPAAPSRSRGPGYSPITVFVLDWTRRLSVQGGRLATSTFSVLPWLDDFSYLNKTSTWCESRVAAGGVRRGSLRLALNIY